MPASAASLTAQKSFKSYKKVQKTYWAIVKNKPQNTKETLVHYLLKNQAKNKSQAFNRDSNHALRSELSYELILSLDNYHLLEVSPKTGRHHQIRVQLAHLGCKIKGDVKYGAKRTNKDGSIHLFARSLSFIHPVKKEKLIIRSNPPMDPLWNEMINLEKAV